MITDASNNCFLVCLIWREKGDSRGEAWEVGGQYDQEVQGPGSAGEKNRLGLVGIEPACREGLLNMRCTVQMSLPATARTEVSY